MESRTWISWFIPFIWFIMQILSVLMQLLCVIIQHWYNYYISLQLSHFLRTFGSWSEANKKTVTQEAHTHKEAKASKPYLAWGWYWQWMSSTYQLERQSKGLFIISTGTPSMGWFTIYIHIFIYIYTMPCTECVMSVCHIHEFSHHRANGNLLLAHKFIQI